MIRSSTESAPPALAWFSRVRALEGRTLTAVAYLCGAVFLLYSFYVALEVIGRRYVGVYTGITDEIGGYVLVFGSSLALAYTLLVDGHVRIDILFKAISPGLRRWFDMLAFASMAIFAWTVTYYLCDLAAQSFRIDATGHSLIEMPQWIIQAFLTLGYFLLGLSALSSLTSRILEFLFPAHWADPLRTDG
ncbi:MAG: TRAP transporter small permease subunit [bacterium]